MSDNEAVERGKAFAEAQRGKPYIWGGSSMTPKQIDAWLAWVADDEAVAAWCEEHGVTVEPPPSTEEILAEMERQSGSPFRAIPWDPLPRWRP